MTHIVNSGQAQAWNGYEGEHWAAHYDRYDAVNGGFNEALLDAGEIDEHARVLDLGCGNGQLTLAAARRARFGEATGVDLSDPMLARARGRAKAENVPNAAFERGDVQVHPFPESSFDVALSRFGVMFFADPVAAFANVARALRPGGRLAFVCMTALSGTDLGTVLDAMQPHVPRPTGPDGTGPTSFADPARTRSVLSDAGFRDIACTRVEADQVWGRDIADAVEFISAWGPVKHHLEQAAPGDAALASNALRAALRRFDEPGGVRLRGTAWLVTARR